MNKILYGVGYDAECCLFYDRFKKNEISFCIDYEDRNIKSFHGLDVLSPEEGLRIRGSELIIVAVPKTEYEEIRKSFCENGLIEFKDFYYKDSYRKKIVLINANCHGLALEEYLLLSPSFKNDYVIYPIKSADTNIDGIPASVLNNVDIYIHQDIKPDNGVSYYISDEWTVGKIKGDNICIPNVASGLGQFLFPTIGNLDKVLYTKAGEKRFVMFRDYCLDEAYESLGNKPIDSYLEFFNRYIPDNLEEIFETCIFKIRNRQKNWDVSIYEYILNNYKSIPMFVDRTHPSKYLMREIGRQVAEMLNINDIDDSEYEAKLGIPVPLLPKIKEHYGINYKDNEEIRKCFLRGNSSDVLQYMRAYMWFYHGYVI